MPPAPFRGLVIAASGTFSGYKQADLKVIVENGGGTFSSKVTNECTHLVTTPKEVGGNSSKYKQACLVDNCQIVSVDWLVDSQAAKKKAPEQKYILSQKDSAASLGPTPAPAEVEKKRRGQSTADAEEPPAKKLREKPTAEKKKLHIPVDEACKSGSSFEVYIDEEGVIWDASLNLTVASNNNNKFYRIQLLKSKTTDQYATWTRWGRVGEIGSGAMIGSADFANAKKAFEKKFRDKSGLLWANRMDTPKDGKYTFVEIDYEDDEDDGKDAADNGIIKKEKEKDGEEEKLPEVKSTLPEPVQQLVALIFNQEYALLALEDMNFDANKLPLGKLSKRTLQTGFEVLKELSELMNDASLAQQKYGKSYINALELLSNRYFTIIPHAFGRNRPPVISHPALLKKEVELLDNLTDMEISNKIFKDSLTDDKVHLLDKQYKGLNLDEMTPLSKTSTEFSELKNYLFGAHGPTHGFKYTLLDIFRIERNGESKRFEEAGFTKIPNDNRRLLWHGSRSTNFGGILSQGLRIAPPEAPVNGYMFGKGVYLADISSKSAGYCATYASKNVGLLLLCEVQLGDPMQELEHASFTAGDDAKAAGKLATLGLGATIPLGWKDAGCVHPSLQGVSMPDVSVGLGSSNKSTHLLYNEYIVYDVAQIRQRYLLMVRMS